MTADLKKLFFKYGLYYPVTFIQGGGLRRSIRALEKTQFAHPTEIKNLQLEKIQKLVRHAKSTVPWHQSKLKIISPDQLTNFEKFADLPFVTKADIQSNSKSFQSTSNIGRLIEKTSGGSTGQPLTIVKSPSAWINELAATWRGYSWAGVDIGDLQARFWGAPLSNSGRWRARIINWICHRIYCSAFNFTEQGINQYWKKLVAAKPDYFYGYVSMLVEFADHIKRSGKSAAVRPRSIITTSEVLTDNARQHLESVFNTRVYNEYGCGEIGTIAHECEAGRMHLSEENVYVEIVANGAVCAPGEAGEIVVTELNNLAMPLIRYQIGDFGSIAADQCSCGRTLRVLEGLHGRAYDFVESSDGRRFHGEFMMYIFEGLQREGIGLRQFQVSQLDIGKFLIRVVPENDFDEAAREKVIAKIHEHVDRDAHVQFEMVESIPRERSGKMRVIVGIQSSTELRE